MCLVRRQGLGRDRGIAAGIVESVKEFEGHEEASKDLEVWEDVFRVGLYIARLEGHREVGHLVR